MKKCKICGLTYDIKYFSTKKNSKDGLQPKCKKCEKKYNKQYYLKNSENIKKWQDKYYMEHKKERKDYGKKHYKKNSEKIKKEVADYQIKNIKKINIRRKKYRESIRGRDVISNYGYGVSVSDMLEWQDYKCAICGETENGKRLDIDHDHKTKQVRMLLCRNCNTGTKITDNWELLLAKSEYIKTYST